MGVVMVNGDKLSNHEVMATLVQILIKEKHFEQRKRMTSRICKLIIPFIIQASQILKDLC